MTKIKLQAVIATNKDKEILKDMEKELIYGLLVDQKWIPDQIIGASVEIENSLGEVKGFEYYKRGGKELYVVGKLYVGRKDFLSAAQGQIFKNSNDKINPDSIKNLLSPVDFYSLSALGRTMSIKTVGEALFKISGGVTEDKSLDDVNIEKKINDLKKDEAMLVDCKTKLAEKASLQEILKDALHVVKKSTGWAYNLSKEYDRLQRFIHDISIELSHYKDEIEIYQKKVASAKELIKAYEKQACGKIVKSKDTDPMALEKLVQHKLNKELDGALKVVVEDDITLSDNKKYVSLGRKALISKALQKIYREACSLEVR